MLENLKQNKILKIIYNLAYGILFLVILAILFIVIMQRVSNNTVSIGGIKFFNIVSESMAPKYVIGDVLLAQNIDASEIKIGDDIVYKGEKGNFADKIVTHQVVKTEKIGEQYMFTTRGIANEEDDPEISESQILGIIKYKIKIFSLISKVMQNIYAFYFIIFIPVIILIFMQIRNIILSFKK